MNANLFKIETTLVEALIVCHLFVIKDPSKHFQTATVMHLLLASTQSIFSGHGGGWQTAPMMQPESVASVVVGLSTSSPIGAAKVDLSVISKIIPSDMSSKYLRSFIVIRLF